MSGKLRTDGAKPADAGDWGSRLMVDLAAEAWRTLWRHPLRSGLCVLGIAIAVGAIVAVVAVEQSWQQAAARGYEKMGRNRLLVETPRKEFKVRRRDLQLADAEAVRQECAAVQMVSAVLGPRLLEAKAGRDHATLNVYGVEPDFLKIREWRTEALGSRSPSPHGCWISPRAARSLLGEGYRDRLPAEVRIAGRKLSLNGLVLVPEPVDEMGEGYLLLPLQENRALLGEGPVSIEAWAQDPPGAARQVDQVMSRRLGARAVLALSTGAWRVLEMAIAGRTHLRLFTAAALASVLVVALLGLASTLLASLEERVRELALRRSLGAQARRVAAEVLCEAGLMSLLGGLLGCGLAFLALHVVDLWLCSSPHLPFLGEFGPAPAESATAPLLSLPWQALVVGWTACLGGTLAAASIPGSMAAALNPAQALAVAPSRRQAVHRLLALTQLAAGVAAAIILFSLYAGLARHSLQQLRRFYRADIIIAGGYRYAKPLQSGPYGVTYQYYGLDQSLRLWQSAASLTALQSRCRDFGTIYRSTRFTVWAKRGRNALQTTLTGVDAGADAQTDPYPATVARGRAITDAEGAAGAHVCVLLGDLAQALFGRDDPLGQQIRLDGLPFTVVGIDREDRPSIEELGEAPRPRAPDYRVVVPNNAVASHWPSQPGMFYLLLRRPERAEQAEAKLAEARRDLARLPPGVIADTSSGAASLAPFQQEAVRSQLRALLIGSTGFWAALVGLANMLFASAHARTREIGLLRALGATRTAVMQAVLTEGASLSAVGVLVGLGLAAAMATVLGRVAGLPVAIPAGWAAVVIGGAVLVSIIAALLPASRAAAIHPSEALRHE